MSESVYGYASALFHAQYTIYNREYVHGAIGTVFSLNRRLNSGGVYVYWSESPDDHRSIYYIGETASFRSRFFGHNLGRVERGNKKERIQNHLAGAPMRKLGITLIANHNQDLLGKHRPLVNGETENETLAEEMDKNLNLGILDKQDDRKRLERILLRAYRERHGSLPPWSDESQKNTILSDEVGLEAERLLDQIERRLKSSFDYPEYDLLMIALKMEESIPGGFGIEDP